MAAKPNHQLRFSKTNIFFLVIVLLFIYLLIPHLRELKTSTELAENAERNYLFAALALVVGTYLFATLTYVLIAKHRIRFFRTLLIQVAASCANRLLPAGLGGLSLNTAYLVKNKHKLAEGPTVAAANNLIGLIGHLLILGFALLLLPSSLKLTSSYHLSRAVYLSIAVLVIGIILSLVILPKIRHWLENFSLKVIKNIIAYRRHPGKVFLALISSVCLTFCYVLALKFCMLAFGVHLDFTEVMVIFTLGALIGTVTPTPGGLIGIEVGLIAGFVAFGVGSTSALAIVLTYRFISYWLPILPGFIALLFAEHKSYIAN